jgi:hypothetical protein
MTDEAAPSAKERDRRAVRIWNGCLADREYTPGHIDDEIRAAEQAAAAKAHRDAIEACARAVRKLSRMPSAYEDAIRDLADGESDSDENYIQGVRRGGFTAINTIIAMPISDDHSRGDWVTQYFVREDCIEAIREAIQKTADAARAETADGGEVDND